MGRNLWGEINGEKSMGRKSQSQSLKTSNDIQIGYYLVSLFSASHHQRGIKSQSLKTSNDIQIVQFLWGEINGKKSMGRKSQSQSLKTSNDIQIGQFLVLLFSHSLCFTHQKGFLFSQNNEIIWMGEIIQWGEINGEKSMGRNQWGEIYGEKISISIFENF